MRAGVFPRPAFFSREKRIIRGAGCRCSVRSYRPCCTRLSKCRRLFRSASRFGGDKAPDPYRSLALCVIDSVQSTGVTYGSVKNVVARYRAYRKAQGADPNTDGISELLVTFDELGGPEGWADRIGNRNRTSSRNGVLKAEAIRDAARAVSAEGIETTHDLREAVKDEERFARLQAAWCAVKGQRRGITWHYLQMLAGIPGVKPDRMICRFVADSLGLNRNQVTPGFALEIVTAAAAELKMDPRDSTTRSGSISAAGADPCGPVGFRRRRHSGAISRRCRPAGPGAPAASADSARARRPATRDCRR